MEIKIYNLKRESTEEAPGVKYKVGCKSFKDVVSFANYFLQSSYADDRADFLDGAYLFNTEGEALAEALRKTEEAWKSYLEDSKPKREAATELPSLEELPSKLIWLSVPQKIFLARRRSSDKPSAACTFIDQDTANAFIKDTTNKVDYSITAAASKPLYEKWKELF